MGITGPGIVVKSLPNRHTASQTLRCELIVLKPLYSTGICGLSSVLGTILALSVVRWEWLNSGLLCSDLWRTEVVAAQHRVFGFQQIILKHSFSTSWPSDRLPQSFSSPVWGNWWKALHTVPGSWGVLGSSPSLLLTAPLTSVESAV